VLFILLCNVLFFYSTLQCTHRDTEFCMKVTNNSSNKHTFLALQYNRVFAIRKIYRMHSVVVLLRNNEYSSIKGWCCGKLENGVLGKSENQTLADCRYGPRY
jgi:hypothetical protein